MGRVEYERRQRALIARRDHILDGPRTFSARLKLDRIDRQLEALFHHHTAKQVRNVQ